MFRLAPAEILCDYCRAGRAIVKEALGWRLKGIDNRSGEIAEFLKEPIIRELEALFKKEGSRLYLVGGSVRDFFLGNLHNDLDFATDSRPEDTHRIVKKWADSVWLTGMAFGTVALKKNDFSIEITTFRRERYPEDSRHPAVSYSDDLREDLSRRDFTINAVAVGIPYGQVIDPFDGLRDLREKRLKTPLSAKESFLDDPLRMLRALRFASTLDVEPVTELLEAIVALRKRLGIISQERIREELSKTLLADHPEVGLRLAVTTHLADDFLPELMELALERDPEHRHKDLLEHTLAVVAGVPPELTLRLAALFHDVGKARTKTVDEQGVHFFRHELVGASMTAERLRRLRYPRKLIADVKELVLMHMRFHTYRLGWTDKAIRKYLRDAGALLSPLNLLIRADCTSRNPARARECSLLIMELEERIVRLEAAEESAKIRPPLDGTEVMEFLEIGPGPKVGEALKMLLEARLEDRVKEKEDAYELLREWAREQGLL